MFYVFQDYYSACSIIQYITHTRVYKINNIVNTAMFNAISFSPFQIDKSTVNRYIHASLMREKDVNKS